MFDDRMAQVLEALVEEYIHTGEPVSSRAVLERGNLDVSSATVRNDLARLESYGLVSQPHTSAGRVPTAQGYRYYVDNCAPARLRAATRARIESFFSDMHQELSRLLKETSGLLSDITHYPAVVIGPEQEDETLHGVHLVRIGGPVLLVVIVAESGRVSQHVVRLTVEPTPDELTEAEALLGAAFSGRTIRVGQKHARQVAKTELAAPLREIIDPVSRGLRNTQLARRDVFVGGTSQLAELWNDLANVHRILSLLEREAALLEMLEDDEEGTSVRIGAELGDDVDMAVVSASYDAGGSVGRVGVIGPMRMDYRRTIKVVEEVGESLADSFGG